MYCPCQCRQMGWKSVDVWQCGVLCGVGATFEEYVCLLVDGRGDVAVPLGLLVGGDGRLLLSWENNTGEVREGAAQRERTGERVVRETSE